MIKLSQDLEEMMHLINAFKSPWLAPREDWRWGRRGSWRGAPVLQSNSLFTHFSLCQDLISWNANEMGKRGACFNSNHIQPVLVLDAQRRQSPWAHRCHDEWETTVDKWIGRVSHRPSLHNPPCCDSFPLPHAIYCRARRPNPQLGLLTSSFAESKISRRRSETWTGDED